MSVPVAAGVADEDGHLLADHEWHTPAQLHARRDVAESVYTLQKWMRDGELHGHKFGRKWRTRKTVYDACVANLDDAAQARVCGCGQQSRPQLAAVPGQRAPRRGT